VVDTNILFSFFWDNSFTKKLILSSEFELISSEQALKEIKKYKKEIMRKTKITDKQFENYYKQLKLVVDFQKEKDYQKDKKEASGFSPDEYDSDFFALCLKYGCFLWSNDKILKEQSRVKVLSTEDIIELFF